MRKAAIQPSPTTSERPASLWRNRDYLLLWGGQVISSTGTSVSQLAFPLLVLLLTQSPAQAGIVGALRTLPYLIFSLPAGTLIDRWDRKRVMMVCDLVRGCCLASMPVAFAFGGLSLLQIYVVSVVEGTLFVFFDIAELSCLPNVVDPSQLPAAVAQNQATFGITSLLGPPLGGLLYSFSSILPFAADALSYLASVLSLRWIRKPFQQERSSASHRVLREVWEGLVWFWDHPLLRIMAVLSCGINLVVVGGSSLLVIVLAQHAHASAVVIGLTVACGGVGGILGSLLAPVVQRHLSFGQAIIGNVWILALLWPLYALVPNVTAIGILATLTYTLGPLYVVINASYRLTLVPDALQGRVNSAVRLISYMSQPLGLAATGILIQWAGTSATVLVGAGVLLAVAIVATASSAVRTTPRLT